METITTVCKFVGGASVLLISLSLMYVMLKMAWTGGVVGPPATIFIGIFGCFAAGTIWVGASLLIKGSLL